jgi:membrane protein implicated in regulation of membrane protease activity
MIHVKGLLLGVWEFIVGDDWRTAFGVVLALALTALLAQTTSSAWWVMVLAVLGLLTLSVRRAGR